MCLQHEIALVADLLESLHKALPVADVAGTGGQIGVGDHMQILVSVVVVNVQNGEALAQLFEGRKNHAENQT